MINKDGIQAVGANRGFLLANTCGWSLLWRCCFLPVICERSLSARATHLFVFVIIQLIWNQNWHENPKGKQDETRSGTVLLAGD
jgi:hypothetical protein